MTPVVDSDSKSMQAGETDQITGVKPVTPGKVEAFSKTAVVKDDDIGVAPYSPGSGILIVDNPGQVPIAVVSPDKGAPEMAIAAPLAMIPCKWIGPGLSETSPAEIQPEPEIKNIKPAGMDVARIKAEPQNQPKVSVAAPVPWTGEKIEWTVVRAGESQSAGNKDVLRMDGNDGRRNIRSSDKRLSQAEEYGDYEKALEYFEKRKYDAAISLLNNVLDQCGKDGIADWRSQELLGRCMHETGRPVSALLYYRRSLEINPGNAELQALVEEMEGKVSSWSKHY